MINLTRPENVGLSADRLDRIASRFNRYVDEGKLPGYIVLIARRGKAVYIHRYGLRDVEAGLPGEFGWGGAASATFSVDRAEQMTAIFLTQLMPSSSYPIRRQLRVLANQAIVD